MRHSWWEVMYWLNITVQKYPGWTIWRTMATTNLKRAFVSWNISIWNYYVSVFVHIEEKFKYIQPGIALSVYFLWLFTLKLVNWRKHRVWAWWITCPATVPFATNPRALGCLKLTSEPHRTYRILTCIMRTFLPKVLCEIQDARKIWVVFI